MVTWYWSTDSLACFDRCQFIIAGMSNFKEVHGKSPWAGTLKRAIWYQNEGQILTPIFNNFDSSWLFWCMITMPKIKCHAMNKKKAPV